jgi:hypothetical protein
VPEEILHISFCIPIPFLQNLDICIIDTIIKHSWNGVYKSFGISSTIGQKFSTG